MTDSDLTTISEAVRAAWAADTEGIGRAVYELISEALAVPGAIVPGPGERSSVVDLGDIFEARIGTRQLAIWPRRTVTDRAAEILRRTA